MTRLRVQAALLILFALYSGQKLVRSHIDPSVDDVDYMFERELKARRGSIYDATGYPLVKSVPIWEYHLDPVALTNRVVRRKGEPPRPPAAIVKTVASALGLNFRETLAKSANYKNRYQFLARSTDSEAHRIIADSRLVAGVAISDKQERQYLHGTLMSHVLGSINAEEEASAGLELKYDRFLTGVPGRIQGMKDANGRELYDKRKISIDPIAGADIHLTLDHNLQYEAENQLKAGIEEFGAAAGWAIIMNATNGAVLAMASYPDFDPSAYGKTTDEQKLNRCVGYTYEPGSVMKVITVASALNEKFVRPDSLYNTKRDDPNYYRLPGDGSHVWEPYMSVADAVVHSSNIVVGKLGYDFGQERLYNYMRTFGFGAKTGIELPGEEVGILRDWKRWDKATWSRAPIGQAVAVTPIQLVSAYQAIANDGLRMRPHLIDRIVGSNGEEIYRHLDEPMGRPISAETARTMREVMKPVASAKGTARRAAIKGYSVAGKTGTAQKKLPGQRGYASGLYIASFCGIVPADNPAIVVLVSLDFDAHRPFHQGGNSSAVVFRKLTTEALKYLMVPSDKPEEIFDEDLD